MRVCRPTRDFNFVDDTVEGFLKIAECPKAIGEVVNIGSGKESSVGDLAKLLVTLIGRDIPITFDAKRARPKNSEVDRLCADNQKAKSLLNWQPRVSLREGLGKTIDWLGKNLEQYKANFYNV